MLECFNETINGKLCLCYNSPRFYQITSNKRTKINISWESMPPDPPISFWGMFLMHKWRICVCMKSGVATYLGGGRKRSMGAWTSGQSECTDITGYNGMDVWSVFCITQWGTWSIRTFILTRLSCLHPLAHLHTFCTQKMHRKITQEEILCAAYAQKLGFLVIKLIICWGFSAVTRLFQKDVDEQLIISVTGDCSTDGVRAYKRVSNNQKQQLSEHLQAKTCNEENIPMLRMSPPLQWNLLSTSVSTLVMQPQSSPVQQPIVPQHPVLNIQGCSSVVINYRWIWSYLWVILLAFQLIY